MGTDDRQQEMADIRVLADAFAASHGRRPRILVAKIGDDPHDRGARLVAAAFADMGFDVDLGPSGQTSSQTARQAVENDVHVVGLSVLAGSHRTLIPEIIKHLRKLGRDDIMVIAGGVIPSVDHEYLHKQGVAAIFGPETQPSEAARQVLEELNKRFGYDLS